MTCLGCLKERKIDLTFLSKPVDDMMRGKGTYFLYTHTKDMLVAKVS